jgi:hypothetical protein
MNRAWATVAALGGAAIAVVAAGVLARALPLRLYLLGALAVMWIPAGIAHLREARRAGHAPVEALLAGGALAALLAPATWVVAHPLVHVDNATGDTIQLWVDGARGPLLEPGRDGREPPRVRVAVGTHRFGWSSPGEEAPREETLAQVGALDEHLYNPAGAGCYWIEAAAYGDAETRGTPHGPQRIASFYRLDRVDVWFAPAPRSALVARVLGGTQKLALQRHRVCMELAALGCGRSLRAAFLACERTFTGPGEPLDCVTIARTACSAYAAAASASAATDPAAVRKQGGDERRPEQ